MKICWEVLDQLRLTYLKFGPKKYRETDRPRRLISDWGIEIDGAIRYIDMYWEYIDHCWYCGSDFLKPLSIKGHYCDSECRHLHSIWKRAWERLRKQRWKLMRNPKQVKKPTTGVLGQPLGLKYGTPEYFEMRSTIGKMLTVDVVGRAQYDLWVDKIWYVEGFRREPENPKLLQIRCLMCNEWYTPKPKKLSRVNRWANIGKSRDKRDDAPIFYCSVECGILCRSLRAQTIKDHKYKIGEIRLGEYHKIPDSILYYDWQLELEKIHKRMRKGLPKKQREAKRKEKENSLWKGKRDWKRGEARPNPFGIYMCINCRRFMGKDKFSQWNICMDNMSGKCKKCMTVCMWIIHEGQRQKMRDNTRRWAQNNKNKRRETRKQRGLKKKEALDPTANNEDMIMISNYARMLTIKTGILHEVDHKIPTSKGGKHHEDNLQVLTWMENNEKSNKLNTGITGPGLVEIKVYYNIE